MLAKKAILNFIAASLDQITRIGIVLVLSPLILSVMGSSIFGYWQVLLRSCVQLQPLDGRSSELLKWKITQLQSEGEVENRKNQIGAALTVWAGYFPILVVGSTVFFYFLPVWVGVDQALIGMVRLAGWVLIFNLVLLSIIGILESVFRGMNLGYKRMGLMSFTLLLGGIFSVLVIKSGGTIIHLAGVQALSSLFYLAIFIFVVKKYLPWIGFNRPHKAEVRDFGEKSFWFMLWAFVNAGIFLGDILLLGFLGGSDLVTKYTVTNFAAQSIVVVIVTAVMAVLPGMGGILEAGSYNRAQEIWLEAKQYIIFLITFIASMVLLLNEIFVSLWVGAEYFAGTLENVLIVLCGIQIVFVRQDAAFINLLLNVKEKVALGLVSLSMTCFSAYFLVPVFEIVGLCISLILGRSILSIRFPIIIKRLLRAEDTITGFTKTALLAMPLFLTIAWVVGQKIAVNNWLSFVLLGWLLSILFIVPLYYCVLPAQTRILVISRLRSLLGR